MGCLKAVPHCSPPAEKWPYQLLLEELHFLKLCGTFCTVQFCKKLCMMREEMLLHFPRLAFLQLNFTAFANKIFMRFAAMSVWLFSRCLFDLLIYVLSAERV
jgi:hypothetical protein